MAAAVAVGVGHLGEVAGHPGKIVKTEHPRRPDEQVGVFTQRLATQHLTVQGGDDIDLIRPDPTRRDRVGQGRHVHQHPGPAHSGTRRDPRTAQHCFDPGPTVTMTAISEGPVTFDTSDRRRQQRRQPGLLDRDCLHHFFHLSHRGHRGDRRHIEIDHTFHTGNTVRRV